MLATNIRYDRIYRKAAKLGISYLLPNYEQMQRLKIETPAILQLYVKSAEVESYTDQIVCDLIPRAIDG